MNYYFIFLLCVTLILLNCTTFTISISLNYDEIINNDDNYNLITEPFDEENYVLFENRGVIGDIEKLQKIGEILQVVGEKIIPVLIDGGQNLIQNHSPSSQSSTGDNLPNVLQLLNTYKEEVDDMA